MPNPQQSNLCSCSAPLSTRYRGLSDRLFGVRGEWSILECSACGLHSLDPRPSAEEIPELYASYYTHEEVGDEGFASRALLRGVPRALLGYSGGSPLERMAGRVAARSALLREIGERAVLGLRAEQCGELLDFGCGSGAFLERMQTLGWRVTGFDPDARALERAREKLGERPLFSGAVRDIEAPAGGFDVITLAHVIEHLPNPEATLRGLATLLSRDGRILLVTPNAESLGQREFGATWLHWDPPRHLQVFSMRALRALVERCGLEATHETSLSSTAHFAYRASAQIAAQGSLPGGTLAGGALRKLGPALRFWQRESRAIRAGQACGEELLMVARRPEENS